MTLPTLPARSAASAARERRAAADAPGAVPDDATDAELVVRTRRGDAAAGDLLARRCRRSAYLLALQLLRDPDDALDVAQDALLRLFAHLDRIEPGREVRPWLLAIVRNRVRDLARRRRVRRTESLERDDDAPPRPVVDPAPGPEAAAELAELQRHIWRLLGELSEPQREILVLRDYQDLSYEEIAGVLDVPLGTVMSRLHRARRALRDRLLAEAPGWRRSGRDREGRPMRETPDRHPAAAAAPCGRRFPEEMLSGYLDGALTQGEEQRVRIHLEDCPDCRAELDALRRLREAAMKTTFDVPPPEEWGEAPRTRTSRVARGTGWLLLIVWLLALSGYALWSFAVGPESPWEKLAVFAALTGAGLLFVSILLDRLRALPGDRYRRIQR